MTDQPRSCKTTESGPPGGLGEGGQARRWTLTVCTKPGCDAAWAVSEDVAKGVHCWHPDTPEKRWPTERIEVVPAEARALLKDGER